MKRFTTLSEIMNDAELKENFFNAKEEVDFDMPTEIVGITEGNRLIDAMAVLNESVEELNELSGNEKYALDNLVWEGVYFYATNDEDLFEGFWSNVVGKAKDIGTKGIKYAQGLIKNIGKFFKDIGKYISQFFKKLGDMASKYAMKTFGSIKGKLDEKNATIKDGLKEDRGNWKDTVGHFRNAAVDKILKKNVNDGAALANKAGKEDQEGKERAEKKLQKELENPDGSEEKNESYEAFGILHAINEMRKQGDFDFQAMIEEAEIHAELCAIHEDAGQDASKELEAETAEKKKGLLAKIKDAASLGNIVGFITSGIVKLFENVIEWCLKKSFKGVSALSKMSGGPGVFKFLAISALLAIVAGLIIEFGLDSIGDMIGMEELHHIAHGLHATSPMYWLGKGAKYLIPGGKTYVMCIQILIILYMGSEHLFHKAHKEGAH